MLISLAQYAAAHGKTDSAARRVAIAGRFQTAKKLGRDWVIDENEPWPVDRRVKSGNYADWRKKHVHDTD